MWTVVVVLAAFVASCGDDATSDTASTTLPASTSTALATTSTSPTTISQNATSTSVVDQPAQEAWPSQDVLFATPEQAASDFVTRVLRVPPVLSEFRQGDSRSGEIEVFVRPEGGEGISRGVLFLRQGGPADQWYVLGAASEYATIAAPETMSEVPAGPLTVSGVGRGFEANINVSAILAPSASRLDEAVAFGGAYETPEPYSVTLDLSTASPGDAVMILVHGGVGLEEDPGDFSATLVFISG